MDTAPIASGSTQDVPTDENAQSPKPAETGKEKAFPRPSDIVAQARTWIGTPYHHAAALKGVGSDCTGLLIGVARELGVDVQADMTYRFGDDDISRLRGVIGQYCDALDLAGGAALQDGDMMLFRGRTIFHHVAIYCASDNTMIHVYPSAGSVVEHEFSSEWERLLEAAYRLKGF